MPEIYEADYGVDALVNGDVRIKLGPVLPFDVPVDVAVKLAALLLKKAGWKVAFSGGVLTARRGRRTIINH